MPATCCVVGCSNRAGRDKISFFRIPKSTDKRGQEDDVKKRRRQAWLQAIGRNDLQGTKLENARVCARHFSSGAPSADESDTHPDWIPSKYMTAKEIPTLKPSPGTIKRKRFRRVQERSRRNLLKSFVGECSTSRTDTTILAQEADIAETVTEQEVVDVATVELVQIDKKLLEKMKEDAKQRLVEIQNLKQLLSNYRLDIDAFRNDDKRTLFYTGLPTFFVLQNVVQLLEPDLISNSTNALSPFEQVILTLIKLRINVLFTDLGYRFGIDRRTASRYFYKCISILYYKLKKLVRWPDREEIRSTMPESFRNCYGDRVAVIIDCFEIFAERASSMETKVQMWSQYKHNYTIKYLIGICPQGYISYISKGYGGRTSDTQLTEDSGMLNNLLPGDIILADRGFRIQDSARIYASEVMTPTFLKGKKQLAPREVESTRNLANVRIHVERVIGSLRQKYSILSEKLPITILRQYRNETVTTIDKIVTVCCALTNLCPGIVSLDNHN